MILHRLTAFIIAGLLVYSCKQTDNIETSQLSKKRQDSLQITDCLDLLKDLQEEKADTFGEVNSIPANFDE